MNLYIHKKKLSLEFDINGNAINIYVNDCNENDSNRGQSYKLSQRSEGLKWYLNFYITIYGENIKNDDVILIDEPGLYLHPKAQEEMREKVLYNFSKQNQIIYTTHSPYLINANELQTIRLVEKKERNSKKAYWEETKIIEKLQSYNKIDTIKPIVDAIGYDVSAELNLNTNSMLICEGVSDCLYIRALLHNKIAFGITHANGVNNILNLVLLYQGLGVKNIYVLIDSDKDGIKVRNQIIEDRVLEKSNVLTIDGPKDNDKSIEDIFKQEFFFSKVMGYSEERINNIGSTTISREINVQSKNNELKEGKYLLAKFFYDNKDSLALDNALNETGKHLIAELKSINNSDN